MKRGRQFLLVSAGLLVFAGVLLAYLPASWVAARIPAELQIACREVGGSVWEGECLGLSLRGARLGDATWNVGRMGALTGRLVGDVNLRGAFNARADVDLSFSATGELRNVRLDFPLDPAILPGAPAQQRGEVHADLARLVLENRTIRGIEGTIDLTNLRQVVSPVMDLGSYRGTFDGAAAADGAVVGRINDLGGAFAVDATLTLTPPDNYRLQGFITGRTVDAERLVRNQIALGTRPDASGRSEFGIEGSY